MADVAEQHEEQVEQTPVPSMMAFDLGLLTPGKAFAGMAAGTFVDMNGREVTVDADTLREFADNTRALIADYKERGMPGLPIDARRHDKGDAAGWIVGVEETVATVEASDGEAVPVIRLLAEWTRLGVELLGDKVFANFSPTLDLNSKVIRGGSLTNWPASVDKAGVPLFEAVELAQGVYALSKVDERVAETDAPDESHSEGDEPMADEAERQEAPERETDANDPAQLVDLAQVLEALNAEGDVEDGQLAELNQIVERKANLMLQQRLAQMQREQEYAELAQQVTGGTDDAPHGIPADADELKAELMKLTKDQARYWGELLRTIARTGPTDYAELGHSKRVNGARQLPGDITAALDAGDLTVADLRDPILAPALGDLGDYDLSKWEDK